MGRLATELEVRGGLRKPAETAGSWVLSLGVRVGVGFRVLSLGVRGWDIYGPGVFWQPSFSVKGMYVEIILSSGSARSS